MDDRRVADYFVVAGLPDNPQPLEDFSRDGTHLKPTHNQPPIIDVAVFFPGFGEKPPDGYDAIFATPTGFPADLNHGSLRSPEVYLCYRRGREKPPLVDIGVMYEGKERIMPDAEYVALSVGGRPANVNNSGAKTYVTYRRALPSMPCNELVVTDICVILTNKDEIPPHAFCMINKNLNKGMVGSAVYLCYKKSMNRANLISYKAGILARYPLTDHDSFPFPSSVPMFCLPMGSTVECWPATATQPRPVFSTFVLTVSDAAEKVYGSAVTFYERFDKERLLPEQCKELEYDSSSNEKTVNINKCICLLSHWPFFDTFEKFLMFLYAMSCEGSHTVPIERYISHFLDDIPFPSPQRPRILIQLSSVERVILTQPEDLPLPRSGAGFRDLLLNLGPDNCLWVLLLALTEQKLLIHSLRPDVLTAVAEAVSMIIFPFKWQCPYIPLCPLGLAEVLHAPLPFLIGVDSRFFDLYDPPTDVSCVDLDTNNITVCDDRRNLSVKLLPKKPARALRNTLERLYQKIRQLVRSLSQDAAKDNSIDRDFRIKRKEQALELEIQEAFLRFMATVLKGYRTYLLPITKAPTVGTTDTNSLFDLQGFVRSRDKTHHKFFTLVMKTQMFIRFIEERSFVSDMDAGLAFFDECTEKVDLEDGDSRLIELDESHQSERTVFILPPEPTGLPLGATYRYQGFNLNPLLLSRKELKNFLGVGTRLTGCVPGSPMARRTKHEIKSAQKLARKHASSPELWARCLLGTCYSIWFIHLPSYTKSMPRTKVPACLRSAYQLLDRIHKLKLRPTDEVCYRVMMQLCGLYGQPVLAVKLLSQMKRNGLQPNAITYGFYNRAVLEATWPSDGNSSSQLLWNKLRNVILGAALFRRSGIRRRMSEDANSLADAADGVSHTSVDSGNSHESSTIPGSNESADARAKTIAGSEGDTGYNSSLSVNAKETLLETEQQELLSSEGKASTRSSVPDTDFAAFDRYRKRVGSIVRPTGTSLLGPRTPLAQQQFESSAGLLMTGMDSKPVLTEETDLFDYDVVGDSGGGSTPGSTRRRNRSGSCSEFMFGLRHPHHNVAPNCPTSPKPSHSHSPDSSSSNWKLLSRSESFANDAQILRLGIQSNSRPSESVCVNKTSSTKGSSSRSLFGRRGSFNIRRQSRESSTENLEERSSAGSADDLDSTGSHTPKHFKSKLYSWGSRAWDRAGRVGLHKLDSDSSLRKSSTDSLLDSPGFPLHGNGRGSCDLELESKNRTTAISDSELSRTQSSPVQINSEVKCDFLGRNLVNDIISREHSNERINSIYDSPMKSPGSPSQKTSPIRTPVTENDPLGAFESQVTPDELDALEANGDHHDSSSTSLSSSVTPGNVLSEMGEAAGGPVLFGGCGRSRGVSRSATFAHNGSQGEGDDDLLEVEGKPMQRSSTMPVDVPASGGVASSLSSISSSFKLPFSRNSPIRLSLRKADLRIGTQILENTLTNFSPSSLTSRKSNELLLGGLNSLKSAASSAATTVYKKFDEIKEAISANSTPVKANSGHRLSERDSSFYEEDTADATVAAPEERRRISSEFSPLAVQQHIDAWGSNLMELFSDGSRKGSSSNLQPLGSLTIQQQPYPENLYPKDIITRDPRAPTALEIIMTTCSKCHNCLSVLYDEEIMAGWVPEDSNLNTKCQFCDKATVPLLTVNVLDYRLQPQPVVPIGSQESMGAARVKSSLTQLSSLGISNTSVDSSSISEMDGVLSHIEESKEELPGEPPVALDPISVPYLNPLVLRKEFENILYHEGDTCLTQPKFVDEHPIIYWNMVWVFQRINVVSHLPGLSLQASIVNRQKIIHPSWASSDYNNVVIRCMWDNPQLHEEVGQPMYVLWQQNDQPSALVSALLTDATTMSRSVMNRVIMGIRDNDLLKPLMKLAAERHNLKRRGVNRSHSLYRDMLFLAFTVMGRDNIDQYVFDREYMQAYCNLPERELKLYQRCDHPPSQASLYCRYYFKELEL
ncbi:DENN domain-containing protein Crag isoform X2 [Anabrus simplex]|uniref:DENN domain-containing protein Crag isoform X2 n=1 Tax=Anabrus simplex TaxID=316456 RepID=UPI0035A3A0D7